MAKLLISLFVVLHGLVHLWYLALSLKLVGFQPEMGWSGRSWVFTPMVGDPSARLLAAVLYGAASAALVAGGIGILFETNWKTPVLLGSALVSAVTILLFWDGKLQQVTQKGLVGFLISLAMIAVVLSAIRYRHEIGLAQENIHNLGSQIAATECGPIEFTRLGEGYPVLVVHGNGGGFDQGLMLAKSYVDKGFQVIAPSRFGYLRSPLPAQATPALQADAFACLLDYLDIQQAAVIATSAGVTSSIQLALRHPERVSALILHSPNAPGKAGLEAPPQSVFNALLRSDYAFWMLSTCFGSQMQALVGVPKGFTLTPELKAEVRASLGSVLPVSARADGMIFDTYISNPEINTYPLSQIHTPTLVISAVDDPMALHEGACVLADSIPGAHMLAVADGGHLMLGHTDEVRAAITGFLQTQAIALNK